MMPEQPKSKLNTKISRSVPAAEGLRVTVAKASDGSQVNLGDDPSEAPRQGRKVVRTIDLRRA